MNIKDDFKPYIDQFGLTQPKKGEMSGNGLLYTAEYALTLQDNRALDQAESDRLIKVYNNCQVLPGLMRRSPEGGAQWKDQEGPDDYYGVAAASYLLKSSLAKDILDYGRKNPCKVFKFFKVYYVYNNVQPGVFAASAWMGRQQNLICHLQFAAGEKPPIFRKLWWIAAMILGAHAKADHCDSWIMSWLMIRTMDRRSWACSIAASYWSRRMLKTYPNGMSDVFARYFGPDHPLAKWAGKGI